MRRVEMSAQSLARGPDFLDVDEAGLQHVLGVAIFEASLLGAAGADHREDIRPRGEKVFGRQANRSNNQNQWFQSLVREWKAMNFKVSRDRRPGRGRENLNRADHPACMASGLVLARLEIKRLSAET